MSSSGPVSAVISSAVRAPYAEQARAGLRTAVLDAAYDAMVGPGWAATPMAQIAAQVGVSRQTLYNEFGSKDRLAEALVLRENAEFLDGVEEAFGRHPDSPADGVAEAVAYVLERAAEDPLTKAMLVSARDDDLLPFLTTRSAPVLSQATERLTRYLLTHWPGLDPADVAMIAESAVRLVVSHVVLPLAPIETTARQLAELVRRFLSAPPDPDTTPGGSA